MAETTIGAVVIGRNEGERLRRCLSSVLGQVAVCVYVDSGSTDGSRALARGLGAQVVALDLTRPFTAARARNAGFEELLRHAPALEFVQFVDGDCEVQPGWWQTAPKFLREEARCAVACGRRRERYPDQSVYNQLCDWEWDTPVGEARACGGDALMRVTALRAVGGYREELIAGEEPELCLRLRALGWSIWRLDAEMTLHDAAMTRFGQWWQRSRRAGFAFAAAASLHGRGPERFKVRERKRAVLWGLALPVAILLLGTLPWGGFRLLALLLLLAYPLQVLRLALRGRRSGTDNLLQAAFLVLARFPEAQGVLTCLLRQSRGSGQARLIEYK